ncbi:MAG: hypothetical protein V2B19_16460 [Pseudomonadota bacterium]
MSPYIPMAEARGFTATFGQLPQSDMGFRIFFTILLKSQSLPGDISQLAGIKAVLGQIITVTVAFFLNIFREELFRWVPFLHIYALFFISSALRISKRDALSSLDGIRAFAVLLFLVGIILQGLSYFGHPISIPIFQRIMGMYLLFYPVALFGIAANLCLLWIFFFLFKVCGFAKK